MPKPADPQHSDTLMRLRIRPAEPAIDGVTGAEDRGGLFVGNSVRNQVSSVSIHGHVLSVTALRLAPGAFHIGTKHSATALAPFTASTRGLNPCRADAITYL